MTDTLELAKAVPDFKAQTSQGEINLSDFQGKTVVLYFYPKDNTPGCTNEAIDFTAKYDEFKQLDAEVIGISRDSLKSHQKFIDKYEIPFPLISDEDEKICNIFDVIKMKNMYGKQVQGIERSTFVIDKTGKLAKQWRKVKVPGHVDEVLDAVKSLNA